MLQHGWTSETLCHMKEPEAEDRVLYNSIYTNEYLEISKFVETENRLGVA